MIYSVIHITADKKMNFEVSSRFEQEDFCRLCMCSVYELHALFPTEAPEDNSMLLTKICLLAEIIIVPMEELNSHICSRCLHQLEDFDSFRQRCKDSDEQIRQIRASRQNQAYQSAGIVQVTEDSCLDVQDEVSVDTASPEFGGSFDSMEYCADLAVPGEYRLLFDGCVYRRESLLVWRCEVAFCPCQLLVQQDYGKFWIYDTHNHDQIPLNREDRKFEKMNRSIYDFLTKLRDQVVRTNEQGSAVWGSSNGQQLDAANILYYTERDRPIILMNGQWYYKEATTNISKPSQIHWRCSEKNCLGLVTTASDLRGSRMLKSHNHALKSDRNFVRVADLALMSRIPDSVSTALKPIIIADMQEPKPPQLSVAPNNSTLQQKTGLNWMDSKGSCPTQPPPILHKALLNLQSTPTCDSPQDDASSMVTSTKSAKQPKKESRKHKAKPLKANNKKPKMTATISVNPTPSSSAKASSSSAMVFYSNHTDTYYMRYRQRFYFKDVSRTENTPGLGVLWRCIIKSCPATITVFANKAHSSGSSHNHDLVRGNVERLTLVTSSEALQNLPVVPDIEFYRCPTTYGLCLLYNKFSYSLHLRHLPSAFFIWQCKTANCSGCIHSGIELEYLVSKAIHNHDAPSEQTVDAEHRITVQDALQILSDLQNRSQNSSIALLSDNASSSVATET